jgi:uncharacterized protein (TIRG00374 family)
VPLSAKMSTAKLLSRVGLSLAVSALMLYLSVRHANVRAVVAAIAVANPKPVLGYLGILVLVHFVRTVRWGLLLEPLGHVGFRRLNAACAVGFMLIVVLPLRLGELARPLLVSRSGAAGEVALSRSGALASCVVERIIDCLAMGVLGIVSLRLLATNGEAADIARHASVVVTVAFTALCLALVFAFFVRERAVALVRSALRPLSPRLADRVTDPLDRFILALHIGSVGRLAAVLALTAVYWALHVWGFWLVAGAFSLSLTGLMACTVVVCQVVGIMIPAGPGMVGTSQFFTQLGVSIFVPGALTVSAVVARAVAYGNTIWLLQFGQQVLTGLPFLLSGHISLSSVLRPPATESVPTPAK